MIKKSTYVVLLVILLVFFLIMFLLFGLPNMKKEKYSTVLVVGDTSVWMYNKKRWNNVSSLTELKELYWKEYNTFINNEEFGKYYLWSDDKWYLFDDKKEAVPYDGNLLAYSANYEIPVYNFILEDFNDMNLVNSILEENNLDMNSKLTSSGKVSFDMDNDGIVEDFYYISNVFSTSDYPEKVFSIVFMKKNEKVYYIYKSINNNDGFNGCKPFFTSFLDVDDDQKYEFILSCGEYSVSGQIDMLYKFSNDKFKILISNQ